MKKIMLFLLLLCPLASKAQEDALRNLFSVQASFSMSDTYECSVGYHYFFSPYVGLGGYIGSWSDFPDGGIFGEIDEDRFERQNPFLKPTVLLKSATLFSIKRCDFSFGCEPGIMISARQRIRLISDDFKTRNDYRTDWFSWNCNFSLDMAYNNFTFSLLYALSNLDVNREYQNDRLHSSYKKMLVHHIGVKVGCFF